MKIDWDNDIEIYWATGQYEHIKRASWEIDGAFFVIKKDNGDAYIIPQYDIKHIKTKESRGE